MAENRTVTSILQTLAFALLWFWPGTVLCAESESARRAALGAVFGGAISIDSALGVHLRAGAMSADDRFTFLSTWVLPSKDHSLLRVDIGFRPVDPAPPVANQFPTADDFRPVAGYVIAPAVDLVMLGKRLGRLDEIRSVLDTCVAQDPEQQKALLALRTIVALAEGNLESAQTSMQQLFDVAQSSPVVAAERGPEAIAIWVGRHHPEMFEATRDMAMLVYEQARTEQGPRSERWHRHVSSLKRWYLNVGDRAKDAEHVHETLRNWRPTSRMTAETRGAGYPLAGWETRRGQVVHITSHDDDYLYYAIPLQGDFTVEADVTTFDYKEIHLGLGNIWAGPGNNRRTVWRGDIRGSSTLPLIAPLLTNPGNWMRIRMDVRDGLRNSMANGRPFYEHGHTAESDPWLAIHSPWAQSGTVQNLTVSGNPTIPDEINLAAAEELPGWLPYFDESAGRYCDWRWEKANTSFGDTPVLRGRINDYPDTDFESLLRYHRPMFEDGVIEYEFLYNHSPDTPFAVHPALDRLVFLLTSTGVKVHWITDGKYDRTGLDPVSAVVEPSERRGPEQLPLQPNDWNRLRLKLTGDTVDLALNGQHIYSRTLETTNHRTFGLFHYADRTEARIRNIRWKGEWPKELPLPADQELFNDPMQSLVAAGAALPLVLDHNFEDGLPTDRFNVFDGGMGTNITEQSDGLHVTRPGSNGLVKYTLGPRLRLGGDFEITAEFHDMKTELSRGGQCNCYVLAEIGDQQNSHVRIFRGDHTDKQIVYSTNYILVDGKRRYRIENEIAEASTSGRLRLLRRGTSMYYLFAEYNSQQFRLIDTQPVGTEMTVANRIRVGVQTGNPGSTSLVWKRLMIRAEQAITE